MVRVAPQSNIELPLLKVLSEASESRLPVSKAVEKVLDHYPDLSKEDLLSELPSGENRWKNRIRWTRQRLMESGLAHSPERGVWEITDEGRERVGREWAGWGPSYTEVAEDEESLPENMPSKGTMVTYFIQGGDYIKVGKTQDGLQRRVGAIQSSNPEEIEIIGWVKGDVEDAFLAHFDRYQARGEWFYAVPSIRRFVEDLKESMQEQ